MRVFVDGDVFVDHLRGFRQLNPGADEVHYSSVTRAELFAGRSTKEPMVRRLLEPFLELPIDRAVAERAGRLCRRHDIRLLRLGHETRPALNADAFPGGLYSTASNATIGTRAIGSRSKRARARGLRVRAARSADNAPPVSDR